MKKFEQTYFRLIRIVVYGSLFLSHWGLSIDFQTVLYLIASLCLLFDIWESYQAWENHGKHRTKKPN
ncbi:MULTISPECIES: hypothetical protein [unclassified Streptococcus]|uniref:hypothetical protein n=1 Tax=unclassified Streptococcus TaxID=2608887 RepID=UPI0010717449|nr:MULTISPECIES: hypothetical protein [unclassified Streptococcus]MBF0806369.1 hypothetical protein [Streptococcus sp. 19428wA2_WM07]TFU28025.1 hypothetical protein E4T71_06205 [Streptococcus sp. WM07]